MLNRSAIATSQKNLFLNSPKALDTPDRERPL